MQPSSQHRAFGELRGVLASAREGGLGHVLGEMRVAHHAARGGMDEVNVSADQFGERGVGRLSA